MTEVKRGRGRPRLTDEQRAERLVLRAGRIQRLTLDSPDLKTRALTFNEINHLTKLYRGRGLSWKLFQTWAKLKFFKTYVDESRKSPNGAFVNCWLWPDIKGFLDSRIKQAS